jgi:hypothetical protein
MGKKKGKDAFDKTVRGANKKMADFDQQKEVIVKHKQPFY